MTDANLINQCALWGCSVKFEPNEYKDSQFWFLDKNPESDYGYIASNKYVPGEQEGRGGTKALSITGTTKYFKNNFPLNTNKIFNLNFNFSEPETEGCVDTQDDCSHRASIGECETNGDWMWSYCRKSCGWLPCKGKIY